MNYVCYIEKHSACSCPLAAAEDLCNAAGDIAVGADMLQCHKCMRGKVRQGLHGAHEALACLLRAQLLQSLHAVSNCGMLAPVLRRPLLPC